MQPLISAICPTHNRREYLPGALACFLSQTWANKELIIVDDGSDYVGDLIPPDLRIRYLRLDGPRQTIGAKRNYACSLSKGEYIVHLDDDDWSHPARFTEQYKLLVQNNCGVVGYNEMTLLDEANQQAYVYRGEQRYALGTSLFYSRVTWRTCHFADMQIAEDGDFLQRAGGAIAVPAGDRMVARIHDGNTSPKRGSTSMWLPQSYTYAVSLIQ